MESPGVVVSAAARTLVNHAVYGAEGLLSSNRYLRVAFLESGRSDLQSAELAEAWRDRHAELVESELGAWRHLGLPPPAIAGSRPGRYFTLKHERYAEELSAGLSPDYPAWLAAVETAGPKRFLLLVAACLSTSGCTSMEWTAWDSSNPLLDGGSSCLVKPRHHLGISVKPRFATTSANTKKPSGTRLWVETWDAPSRSISGWTVTQRCIRSTEEADSVQRALSMRRERGCSYGTHARSPGISLAPSTWAASKLSLTPTRAKFGET